MTPAPTLNIRPGISTSAVHLITTPKSLQVASWQSFMLVSVVLISAGLSLAAHVQALCHALYYGYSKNARLSLFTLNDLSESIELPHVDGLSRKTGRRAIEIIDNLDHSCLSPAAWLGLVRKEQS
ncbi:hypothetical protein AC578_7768 [Pseudocercospora eumusae]|uniref:Uncharacterized protein n=1 Tax=Pseudocercospora eumusae TaxID=321146 RepID=A0A139H0Y1_9PEZI|nr:hypothetical protein AC578_7768 [Pseudocercospora eumusae]